ncbi:hypothetical protein PP715_22475 [Ralstonia solanacearum]|uniref:Uncharacterized protein n=1 Tax=Ralstonia solanacearum TaxID=305 RepID=A0A5H2PGK9_RALSL|nr:hypothetical protein [Ralstonia solanacearum]AMP69840.1 hypothetical protein UW163_10305 [Ralstonia solanacearum]AYB60224.1 hypothetical protein C2124_06235 [Ralstonia solanacearum]MBB6587032.1 hypothetical protein [Ralstonia solanacearum]MCG3577601.1 hypothetical protein [Ralstonia solanacearum]MCL9840339.1 hypothetical protein [Ralstonia solanacearum]
MKPKKTPNQIRQEFWERRIEFLNEAVADPEIVEKASQAVARSIVMAGKNLGVEIDLERALVDEVRGRAADKALEGKKKLRKNQKKATAATIEYSAEQKARWRDIAREPDLARHTKIGKARLIAKREKLPDSAIHTIRRTID